MARILTEVLRRQGSSSRRTALLSRLDGSGEPSYVTLFRAGVISSEESLLPVAH